MQEMDLLVNGFLDNEEFFDMNDSESSDKLYADDCAASSLLHAMAVNAGVCGRIRDTINLQQLRVEKSHCDQTTVLEQQVDALDEAFMKNDELSVGKLRTPLEEL